MEMADERTHLTEEPRKVVVSVCSSDPANNVQGLINGLTEMTGMVEDAHYVQLPSSDLDNFSFEDKDVFILCHSVTNRRFAITNVVDAVYNQFLPRAAEALGKDRVCVIVHDLPSEELTADQLSSKMADFELRQPTTFENASLVLIGGKLEVGGVELTQNDWKLLQKFLKSACSSDRPQKKKKKRWLLGLFVLLCVCVVIAIILGVTLS